MIHNGTNFAAAGDARQRLRRELGLGERTWPCFLPAVWMRKNVSTCSLTPSRRAAKTLRLSAWSPDRIAGVRTPQPAEESAVERSFPREAGGYARCFGGGRRLALTSDREALPYIVLEGMASSLPVIATSVGAVPEVVTADVGITISRRRFRSLAASMLNLAADPAQRFRLGEGARLKQREFFSADACATRTPARFRTSSPSLGRRNRNFARIRAAAARVVDILAARRLRILTPVLAELRSCSQRR